MVKQQILKIDGMSCGRCVGRVAAALRSVEWVEVERVEVGGARVRYDPERVQPERLAEAVEQAGYAVRKEAVDR